MKDQGLCFYFYNDMETVLSWQVQGVTDRVRPPLVRSLNESQMENLSLSEPESQVAAENLFYIIEGLR